MKNTGSMKNVRSVSPKTMKILRKHGWFPGRSIEVSDLCQTLEESGFVLSDAARCFYAEFSGLDIPHGRGGVECAREAVEFDPLPCLGEEDLFNDWGAEVGHTMSPLGELDRGRFFLGIDEESRIYLIETWLASFGVGALGMDNLILGVMPETIRNEMQ